MRVDELLSSLIRRPLALLLVVLVAAGGAYVGWTRATTTYQSSASVLVVPQTQTDAQGDTVNPFTQLDYNIAQLALVVSRQLGSDAVRDQVVSVGGDGVYSADTMSSDNSSVAQLTPMITLSATAATPDGAQAAVTALVRQAGAQLASVQTASDVPEAAQAQVVTSSAPAAGSPVGNPRIRAAGVLGIAAGVAALLLAVVTTPFVGRRRKRAAEAVVDQHVDVEPEQAEPEVVEVVEETPEPAVVAPPRVSRQATVEARRHREALIRQMVREEWERSGSNVAWTKAQQRAAFDRATRRLDELEAEPEDEAPDNVWNFDDFHGRKNG